MFSVFAISALGYLLGRVSIKGVSLGTAGVFIVALLFGCFFYKFLDAQLTVKVGEVSKSYTSNALKIIENMGLILFVTAVGFIAGPNFFSNLKKNFKSYVLLGLLIIIIGGLSCAGCILFDVKVFGRDMEEAGAMLVGLLSGSLTSTPAFSAAKATVINTAERNLEDIVSVGHGIAYLFGVIGVVLFVQIMPKFVKADMNKERELLKAAETGEKKVYQGKLIDMDPFGFMPFALACVVGILFGALDWGKMIAKLYWAIGHLFNNELVCPTWSFCLTTTGGCLLTSLVFGHFAHFGPVNVTPNEHTTKVFRELGLMLFLIGAGVAGGASFVKYFKGVYFIYGIIMTMLPMIIGYFFAKYVLKLSLLNNLGSITGGMTSTPALGTLIQCAGTEEVASAYAATYPMALIAVVVISQILIIIFR
ncbi:MAG: permease [Treponema sp.]|nr:permease [Treponema sp.]